jgi:hypothetical protein
MAIILLALLTSCAAAVAAEPNDRLQALMQKRYPMPDDQGVRWQSLYGQGLFAFKAFDLPLPAGARVCRVDAGKETPADPTDRLHAQPWTAYRVEVDGAER